MERVPEAQAKTRPIMAWADRALRRAVERAADRAGVSMSEVTRRALQQYVTAENAHMSPSRSDNEREPNSSPTG